MPYTPAPPPLSTGSLEIFNFEGGASEPTLLYRTNLNEAITGMDIGQGLS